MVNQNKRKQKPSLRNKTNPQPDALLTSTVSEVQTPRARRGKRDEREREKEREREREREIERERERER